MALLTMRRGDDRTVVFTFDSPATFGVGDTVWFTVKSCTEDADTAALVALESTTGGVTIVGATATADIPASAFVDLKAGTILVYDWQLHTAQEKVRTLDQGTIVVRADVTHATTPTI